VVRLPFIAVSRVQKTKKALVRWPWMRGELRMAMWSLASQPAAGRLLFSARLDGQIRQAERRFCSRAIRPGAMVALGKVRGNLMIDLHTSSGKLRDRAVRVVAQLAGCDYDSARNMLEANGWNLRGVVGKL